MTPATPALNSSDDKPPSVPAAGFSQLLLGAALFLAFQYGVALWTLAHASGEMANKFSALARDKYLGFLVWQNLQMLVAYVVLAAAAAVLIQPYAALWTRRSK